MKNKIRLLGILSLLLMLAGYGTAMYFLEAADKNEKPEITVEGDILELSVKDGKERLLEGVKASDPEDGDLTEEIIIDSVSPFNQNQERTVKYVVFDRTNQAAEAERRIVYSDYTEPELTLNGPLVTDTLMSGRLQKQFGAVSSVDGDISDRVIVKDGAFDGFALALEVSVMDSTGSQITKEFDCEYNRNIYMADIVLKEYYVELPVGGSYSFEENIKEVAMGNLVDNGLISHVTIQDKVDYEKPGMYEVRYYLQTNKGSGYTKCMVAIEE